jgi:hypothetical protein
MTAPSLSTVKALCAKSGNRCAFPGCNLPIVEEDGIITGIICHICARSKGGPRFDATQSDEDRHGYGNLILLCARHSKVVDSDPARYSVESLKQWKLVHEKNGSIELSKSDAAKAEALLAGYKSIYVNAGGNVMLNSPGAIQAERVTVQQRGAKPKFLPIEGSLGSDLPRRNYVKHLIDRYNDFASKQPGRTTFAFPAIYSSIKSKFKADWERVPLTRFEELTNFLHAKINRTQLGSINRGKGIKNFSSFEEYKREYS